MGIPEKIKAIQEEMAKTQINKATEHHIGLLRAKLAKLKREQEGRKSKQSQKSEGFDVKRGGDATIVFIGLPSVGKSTLLNKLTNAASKVGTYRFTTLTVVPGMLEYQGANIQLLDLPGIIKGASSGKGLGKRILAVARNADLVLLMLDVFQPFHQDVLVNELANIGIRLNQNPPNIVIEKTTNGGLSIVQQLRLTKMSESLMKDILRVYGITNGRILIREDVSTEQFIDFISGNKTYAQSLVVINKIDLVDKRFLEELKKKIKVDFIEISADAGINIDLLKEKVYEKLRFIRIYMRPKGGETDFKEPLIVREGDTIGNVCDKLHRRMRKEFRYAMVWGKSVKFGGQRVGLDHVLHDEDILTIVKSH